MFLKKIPKKAEFSMFFIIAAILGIVTILLLSSFLYSYYTRVKELTAITTCKNSIEAHRFMLESTASEVFTDIKCPTQYKELNTNDEKDLKRAIAEDMRRCWYIWNEGDAKLYQGDGIFCHVCGIYTFEQKDQKVYGFTDYLATTKMDPKLLGGKPWMTYQEYINGYESPMSAELQKQIDPSVKDYDFIDTSKEYATIFVYISGKDYLEKFFEGKGTAFAAGGGGSIMLGGIAAGLGTAVAVKAGVAAGATALIGGASVGAAASVGTAAATGATLLGIPVVGWVVGGIILVGAGVATIYLVYEAKTTESPWVSFEVFLPYEAAKIADLKCQKIDVNQLSHQNTN